MLAWTFLLLVLRIHSCRSGDEEDVHWMWSDGHQQGNPSESTIFGARAGAATYSRSGKYLLYTFGGRKYESKLNKNVLKNDLWYGADVLIHPGSSPDSQKRSDHDVPEPRQFASLCVIHNSMAVVYGGSGQSNTILGDTWLYFFANKRWMTLHAALVDSGKLVNSSSVLTPPPRSDAVTWCTMNTMIIFGGRDHKGGVVEDMWEFSMTHLTWTQTKISMEYMSSVPAAKQTFIYPKPRHGSAAVVTRSFSDLYLFGGNTSVGLMSDLWRYDLELCKWIFVTGSLEPGQTGYAPYIARHNKDYYPGCRHGTTLMVANQGDLWMFGGQGCSTNTESKSKWPQEILADLWNYNIENNVWAMFDTGTPNGNYVLKGEYNAKARPKPRVNYVLHPAVNTLIIIGGTTHDNQLLDDHWRIELHDYEEYYLSAKLGTVVLLLFLAGSGITLSCVFFMRLRKYYNIESLGMPVKNQVSYDTTYTILQDDTDL